MSRQDQEDLRNLRNAIAENPRYFVQYWEHYPSLYGDGNIPEEFFAWEAKNEGYLAKGKGEPWKIIFSA